MEPHPSGDGTGGSRAGAVPSERKSLCSEKALLLILPCLPGRGKSGWGDRMGGREAALFMSRETPARAGCRRPFPFWGSSRAWQDMQREIVVADAIQFPGEVRMTKKDGQEKDRKSLLVGVALAIFAASASYLFGVIDD